MLTTGGGGDPVAVDDFSNLVALGSDGETVGINIDGGNDTISGGTGPDVIVGGQRGGNVIVAGSDPETILGSDATNILCRTDLHPAAISLGGGTHRVAAGLEPSFIQAGSGNSTVFAGDGSGSASGDVVAFMNGTAGGTELIAGFHVGSDLLALRGHAGSGTMAGLAGCQVAGGSTVLTLADDTRVTLQSVTDLGPSSFVWGVRQPHTSSTLERQQGAEASRRRDQHIRMGQPSSAGAGLQCSPRMRRWQWRRNHGSGPLCRRCRRRRSKTCCPSGCKAPTT